MHQNFSSKFIFIRNPSILPLPLLRLFSGSGCRFSKVSCLFVFLISCTQSALASEKAVAASLARLANQVLITDVARSGDHLIAVGDRGHILLSTAGSEWRQIKNVPVNTMLTAVYFVDALGWAVGHDGVILHSQNSGLDWELQQFEPDLEQPLLDVFFTDAMNGYAIGAYGYSLRTRNAGKTWEEARLNEDDDWHLNAIAQAVDGTLVIVAESGNGYRSTDQGESWEAFSLDYGGSMFGLIASDDELVAYGMRGHIFSSSDSAQTWTEVKTKTLSSLFGAGHLTDGSLVIVGAKGAVMKRMQGTSQFIQSNHESGGDLAAVIVSSSGDVSVFGELGVMPLSSQ